MTLNESPDARSRLLDEVIEEMVSWRAKERIGVFRQWVRDFYQGNKLVRNELIFGGRPVRLGDIRCPIFVVGAKEDYIAPPACVRALTDAVGSREKEYIELPGGHISLIAGRGAAVHCWPKVSGWLAPRS